MAIVVRSKEERSLDEVVFVRGGLESAKVRGKLNIIFNAVEGKFDDFFLNDD